MSRLKNIFNLLKETFQEWNEDKAPRLAAALAYYTAFSLAPLLIVIISIAGLIFGREAVQGRVQYQIQGAVGIQAAGAIQDMLANFSHPSSGILATVLGIVTLVLGAAGLFGQLQDALNTIWEVAPKPGQGILAMLRQRFLSFTMVLGICFILLVSLVLSALVSAIGTAIAVHIPQQETVLQIVNIVVSFGVITLLFGAIYKVLPDVKISWRDVWMGAVVTGVLFTVGKYVLGLYLGQSSVASSYGAAGSFVLLLLWIYYSAQILLFGAEFTQVYARTYGSRIEPSKNAIALTERDRVHQGIPHEETKSAAVAAAKDEALSPGATPRPPAGDLQPQTHIGALILGICAALATFVLGMLISTDQKQLK
ncbi:MAG: YihY/virulence factor BrkB family protein [Chloroflexota bacterium]